VALISALGMALSNVDDQSSFNDFISRPIGT
jgi:hypothetical protein